MDVREVQASPADAVMACIGDSVLAAAAAEELCENVNDVTQKRTMTRVRQKDDQKAIWRFIWSGF